MGRRRSKEHCNHKLRRELIASGRQQVCRKCGGDALLEVHHILKYSDDGPADVANLDFLCQRCHVKWHRLELKYDVGYLSWVTNTAVTYRKLTAAQVAAIHEKMRWESPALIARMVALRWEGKTLQQIADILNGEGLRTVRGNLFNSSTIRQMIARADPEANRQNNGWKPEDPALVARVVALRWEGNTCQQIADILNGEGLRTVRGNLFNSSTIRQMIARADPAANKQNNANREDPAVVSRIVDLRRKGKSYRKIADILNSEGLQTANGKIFRINKIYNLISRTQPPPAPFAGQLDFGPAGAE